MTVVGARRREGGGVRGKVVVESLITRAGTYRLRGQEFIKGAESTAVRSAVM